MTVYSGKIKADLTLKKGDDISKVTSIGGSVDVSDGATLQADALTSIGGYEIPDPEVAKARLIAVARAALANPANLEMKTGHNSSGGCGTAHCIAGWAIHLEPNGYDLERKVGSSHLAGNILLGVAASALFFLDNDKARSALHRILDGKSIAEALA